MSSKVRPSSRDFFNELPLDVEHHISSFTDPSTNASLNLTCKRLAVYVPGDAMGHFIFEFKKSVEDYRSNVRGLAFDVETWKQNVQKKLRAVRSYFDLQKESLSIKVHVTVIDRSLSLLSWIIYVARIYSVNQWDDEAAEQLRAIVDHLEFLSLVGVPAQDAAWPSVDLSRVSEKRKDLTSRVEKMVQVHASRRLDITI